MFKLQGRNFKKYLCLQKIYSYLVHPRTLLSNFITFRYYLSGCQISLSILLNSPYFKTFIEYTPFSKQNQLRYNDIEHESQRHFDEYKNEPRHMSNEKFVPNKSRLTNTSSRTVQYIFRKMLSNNNNVVGVDAKHTCAHANNILVFLEHAVDRNEMGNGNEHMKLLPNAIFSFECTNCLIHILKETDMLCENCGKLQLNFP